MTEIFQPNFNDPNEWPDAGTDGTPKDGPITFGHNDPGPPDPKLTTPADVDDAIEQLGSDDPAEVKNWLDQHGFDVEHIPQSDFSPGVNDGDVLKPVTGLERFDTWTGTKAPVSVIPEYAGSYSYETV